MRQAIARFGCAALMALAAASGNAQAGNWGDLAVVSGTLGNQSNRVCVGAPDTMRPADFGCPTHSMYVTSGGLVGIGTDNPNASLDVYGTISATNFVGDGSGLTGVVAGATDRIVSGTNAATRMVAISSTGYISITQAGANAGWFDPYRGLVTLGVSSTGPISGTNGYFRGNVAVGTNAPSSTLTVLSDANINAGSSFADRVGALQIEDGTSLRMGLLMDSNQIEQVSETNALYLNYNSKAPTVLNYGGGKVSIGKALFSTIRANLDVSGTISATDAIQVGQSSLACSSGIPGALRYAGGHIEYCNGTSWGALVGAAEAMGDRIVSGTTNIIAHEDRSLTFTTAGTQRMVVGENGNVGVGLVDPNAALDVSGTLRVSTASLATGAVITVVRDNIGGDLGQLVLANGNGASMLLGQSGSGANDFSFIKTNSSEDLYFQIGQAANHLNPRVVFKSSGLVGINRTSPLARLDVGGSISASDAIQVGTSGLTCGAGIPGAIRYNGGLLQYCNGSSWTTLGAAGGGLEDRIVSGTTNAIAWQDRSLTISTAGSQRMIVGENGYVGIGASDPDSRLMVANGVLKVSGSLGNIMLRENGAAIEFTRPATSYLRATNAAGSLGFDTAGSNTRMVITNTGNVGISVSTPAAKLQVKTTLGNVFLGDSLEGFGSGTDNGGALYFGSSIGTVTETTAGIEASWGNAFTPQIHIGTLREVSPTVLSIEWNGNFKFLMRGTEKARISSHGMGIGTSTLYSSVTVAAGEIQTSSSGKACTSAQNGGAIRYSGGQLYYCNNANAWVAVGGGGGGVEDRIVSGTTNIIAHEDRSLTFTTAGTQRMVVGENGNVGIGTATPVNYGANYRSVEIAPGTVGGLLRVGSAGTASGEFFSDQFAAYLRANGTNVPLNIQTSGTTRIRIDANGSVGISNVSPLAKLDVMGTISASDAIQVGQSTLTCASPISGSIRYNTTSNTIQFCNGSVWTSLSSGTTGGSALGDHIVSGTTNAIAWQDRSLTFTTVGVERMIIGESGGVGIGTTSVSLIAGRSLLHIRGSSDRGDLHLGTGAADGAGVVAGTLAFLNEASSAGSVEKRVALISGLSDGTTATNRGGALAFSTKRDGGTASLTERMRINAEGNVGIGTTAPSATAHVSGSILVAGNDNKPCQAGMEGLIRRNATNGRMELCE